VDESELGWATEERGLDLAEVAVDKNVDLGALTADEL
jgi:hypothetical protein